MLTRATDEGGEAACFAHLLAEDEVASDAAFIEFVTSMADAVVIADAQGTIRFWNEAATRLFGWSRSEAVGQSLDLIIPERLRDRHWAGYRDVMASGHTRYGHRLLEVPASHRDGRTISVAFTVTLLYAPNDPAPVAIAAVLRDDTERWQESRAHRAHLRQNGPQTPGAEAAPPAPPRADR